MPSFAQSRLWFLAQMEGVSDIYHVPVAIRMRGALDLVALEKTLDTIYIRHESLRSTFVAVDGQPVVKILSPESGLNLVIKDLRQKPGRNLD
ncbi:hypothetical protein BGW41_008350, partial [Actinomortierella wolfii]